jgi:hypothetical protein
VAYQLAGIAEEDSNFKAIVCIWNSYQPLMYLGEIQWTIKTIPGKAAGMLAWYCLYWLWWEQDF